MTVLIAKDFGIQVIQCLKLFGLEVIGLQFGAKAI